MASDNQDKLQADGSFIGNTLAWIDARFPMSSMWRTHLSEYYAPKNFNFWYFFGSLALLVLVMQIVTGIFLTMHYKPDASINTDGIPVAFASVEYIMRDVPWGWLIRYMHSTGASAFFVVVYLHMYRGLIYGSYRQPRELIWLIGIAIFLALMGEAFFGYLLPWGQMSYWGAQVIVNLFAAIPFIGPDLAIWLRGDFVVGDATLNRFFAFHVIAVPLALCGLVVAHLLALHEVGSNNPDGIEIKENKDPDTGRPVDGIPFHPYYTVKDIVGVVVFLMVFFAVVFFAPEMNGYFLEANNFFPADPLKTPEHIAPVWYFTPYYSVLRAITSDFLWILGAGALGYLVLAWLTVKSSMLKLVATMVVGMLIVGFWIFDAKFWGVVAMGASVLIFAFLPWLDQSPVKSIRYRGPLFKLALAVFVVSFFTLGYLGMLAPSPVGQIVSQICTLLYFAFFLLMPWWSRWDKFRDVPERLVM